MECGFENGAITRKTKILVRTDIDQCAYFPAGRHTVTKETRSGGDGAGNSCSGSRRARTGSRIGHGRETTATAPGIAMKANRIFAPSKTTVRRNSPWGLHPIVTARQSHKVIACKKTYQIASQGAGTGAGSVNGFGPVSINSGKGIQKSGRTYENKNYRAASPNKGVCQRRRSTSMDRARDPGSPVRNALSRASFLRGSRRPERGCHLSLSRRARRALSALLKRAAFL